MGEEDALLSIHVSCFLPGQILNWRDTARWPIRAYVEIAQGSGKDFRYWQDLFGLPELAYPSRPPFTC